MSRRPARRESAALWAALLLWGLAVGCGHAGAERNGVFEAPGAFRIGKPGDGWRLQRNLREGSRLLVDYRDAGENADVRVSVQTLDDRSRRLPLAVLAEAMMRTWGRGQGLATDVDAIERADFGAHEGIVVFAHRYWPDGGVEIAKTSESVATGEENDPMRSDATMTPPAPGKAVAPAWAISPGGIEIAPAPAPKPSSGPSPVGTPRRGFLAPAIDPTRRPPPPVVHKVERRMAQAFVRAGSKIVIVTCIAPDDAFERVTPEFEAAMQRFAVELPADSPVLGLTLPSDLPQPASSPAATGALPVTTPPAP